jgi:hypothetical protein
MEFLEVTIQCEDLTEELNIDLNGQQSSLFIGQTDMSGQISEG